MSVATRPFYLAIADATAMSAVVRAAGVRCDDCAVPTLPGFRSRRQPLDSERATKATEAAGHTSRRVNAETVEVYADPQGSHTERLVDACWILGGRKAWAGLRRWAHMLGFGGHFLTKSHRYSVTFKLLRQDRAVWQQTQNAGPEQDQPTEQPTVLVVNFLDFVGAGWHTTGDAMLANTAAAKAREHRRVAREEMATLAA